MDTQARGARHNPSSTMSGLFCVHPLGAIQNPVRPERQSKGERDFESLNGRF
jgi:hypothetical protein